MAGTSGTNAAIKSKEAVNQLKNDVTDSFKTEGISNGTLYKLGKPISLPEAVDPKGRISAKLRNKMNIVDLVPCRTRINMEAIKNIQDMSGLLPQLDYGGPTKEYVKSCNAYGLDGDYVGIRLYTTDDTTATDEITNQYGDQHILKQAIDSGSNMFTQARSILGQSASEDIGKALSKQVNNLLGAGASLAGASDNTKSTIESMANSVRDIIMSGHKVSFPTMWQNSSYNSNTTVSFKLISPYGHPDAIKALIIGPLMRLLILASPKTNDGISYGHPHLLTIQSYGMNFCPVGAISSISLNRGGQNSSFNMYRQPMSINVSLQFRFLIDGFAHFTGESKNHEGDVYGDAAKFANEDSSVKHTPTLSTVGKIVQSLKPVEADHFAKVSLSSFTPNNTINEADSTRKNANETGKKITDNTNTSDPNSNYS